ncbi:MAG: UDP-3-O-[3-hydroxymyristoyl] N-acetylglucosamine deacetylase, partial [Marinilabiliales bacterium]
RFIRTDIENTPEIKACIENVSDTQRGTSLKANGAGVSTVEHVLSAVFGLGIDNIIIEIDSEETPILDGSASQYVDALKKAGIVDQEAEREYFEVKDIISYKDKDGKTEITAIPSDEYCIDVLVDYDSQVIVNQFASICNLDNYETEIAGCRTFVFLHELEVLLKRNQIKGGDLNNAIIIMDKEVSQEELDRLADLFGQPRMEVKPIGILNNLDLKFNNEPARHKLLDIIGDLALAGVRIKGKIIATRPGHASNLEFAKKISSIYKKQKITDSIPTYDQNIEPIMDINKIKTLLPHRPPFLLVDKIIEINDTSIVGLKNVSMNEGFFVGHFPEEPVMPGVLQVEAMAQVGGLLVLNSVDDPENYSTYFIKIENVKFKRKVVPGDTILFKLEFISPLRRGIAHMRGKAYVGNTIVMEGEMMAQIVKNKG